MAVLDDIINRESAVEDQRLGQAAHAASWTQTFNGPQSTEALRAARNVTDMANQAIERKSRLLAQTDKNALEIYAGQEHLKEFQRQAPLREQLLQAQIASQGATARFNQAQQARTEQHLAGFMDAMADAPDVTDPKYHAYTIDKFRRFPLAATTDIGKQTWKTIADTHDIVTKLTDLAPPAGTEVSSVTMGRKGVQQATFRPAGAQDSKTMEAELTKGYGITLGQLRAPLAARSGNVDKEGNFTSANAGNAFQVVVPDDKGGNKTVTMSRAEFERFGGPIGEKDKTQAVDKKSLAQKALDDPNASPAHKAAARKILGDGK